MKCSETQSMAKECERCAEIGYILPADQTISKVSGSLHCLLPFYLYNKVRDYYSNRFVNCMY